ncbi:hypothetical protein TNCV_1048571 [Trichonephila clavipes]|nr:hypothetical protein TNCV_1048571 [Trichonephila clavipes]
MRLWVTHSSTVAIYLWAPGPDITKDRHVVGCWSPATRLHYKFRKQSGISCSGIKKVPATEKLRPEKYAFGELARKRKSGIGSFFPPSVSYHFFKEKKSHFHKMDQSLYLDDWCGGECPP